MELVGVVVTHGPFNPAVPSVLVMNVLKDLDLHSLLAKDEHLSK